MTVSNLTVMSGYFSCTSLARSFQTWSPQVSDHIDQRNVPEVPPPPQPPRRASRARRDRRRPSARSPCDSSPSPRNRGLELRRSPLTRRPATIPTLPSRPTQLSSPSASDITRTGCASQQIRRTYSTIVDSSRDIMATLGIKHPSFVRISGWSAVDSGLECRQK